MDNINQRKLPLHLMPLPSNNSAKNSERFRYDTDNQSEFSMMPPVKLQSARNRPLHERGYSLRVSLDW